MLRDSTGHVREIWLWLGALLLVALIFGCLALLVINAGPGFGGEGHAMHFRLEMAITNYPFCPPQVPCPVSVVLPTNHLVVWIMTEKRTPAGVETGGRKVVDIALWY